MHVISTFFRQNHILPHKPKYKKDFQNDISKIPHQPHRIVQEFPKKIAPKIWFVHCPGSLSFAIFLRLKTSYTLLRAHFNIVREIGSKKTWNGKITFAKILCMQLFLRTCFRRRLVHERKVKSLTLLNRICNVIPTYTD